MKLVPTRAAQRRLGQLAPKMRAALIERLHAIAQQPLALQDAFRLRQRDWRALYRIERAADEMRVLAVEPRGRVSR